MDLRIGLLATPGSFTAAEFEGWLSDLVGVARETSRTAADPGPIPALLHQALSGLLFSHAELWERAGGAYCSMALVTSGDEIGIGWVGGVDIEVRVNGESSAVAWVIVRDAEGREARAARFDARQVVHVELSWLPSAASAASVEIGADWPGDAGAEHSLTSTHDTLAHSGPSSATGSRAPADASADETTFEMAGNSALEGHDAPIAEARGTPPPRRGWSSLWKWMTGRGGRRPIDHTAGQDPPWVDVGGLAAAEGAEEFYQGLEPNLRALGPPGLSAGAPQLRSPQSEIPPPGIELAMPREPERAGPSSPVAPPVLRVPTPDSGVAPLEPHAAALERPGARPATPGPDPHDSVTAAPGLALVDRTSPPRPSLVNPAFETPEPMPDQTPAPMPGAPDPAAPGGHSGGRVTVRSDSTPPVTVAPDLESEFSVRAGAHPARAGVARRPQWPSAAQLDTPTPFWGRRWVWGVAIAILFGVGWMVGAMQNDESAPAATNPFTRALHAVGLGGAHFDCRVESRPPGAWITVDGRPLARRTPASLELKPGPHLIGLAFADLGAVSVPVHGVRGDQVSLDEPLWGSLTIDQVDPGIPVTVAVDGRDLGYVPAMLDSVMPGAHEVRFSGPGMTPWAQTVQVRVREAAHLMAHPMTSPKTGVLAVSATRNDENGSGPLTGGEVWVDGQLRGQTPLTLELPRGPHSLRVTARGESAPVQVIDLPGGNQRYAKFELGLGAEWPRLTPVLIAAHVAPDRPTLVSATLQGVSVSEIREMWLHVRCADGPWRRYALDVKKTPGGVVGVTVFPLGVFDADGRTQYYLSALTATGDEYFTEMAPAQIATPQP